MKFNRMLVQGVLFTIFSFMLIANSSAIDIFGDENVLWRSGENLYIKLDKQDRDKIPNDHPVKLDSKSITNALLMLEYVEGNNASETSKVFAFSQARLLGNYLSTGLAKANPGQDIVFALATNKVVALGVLREKVFMSGRAFYQGGRLHIIIGDYDRTVDKGREATAGGAGITEVKYFFNVGRRGKESSFKKNIITGNGIDFHLDGNRKQRNWFEVDVAAASAAYVARVEQRQNKSQGVNTEALEQESARLARERREMRAEMARMRKEMKELSGSGDGTSLQSVEERIATLDELLEKDLISREEYEIKRREILDDI